MMIEMPPRELTRRDAARHGVQPAERTLEPRPAPLEHRVMHHFVEQNREVENREALHECERNPHDRVGRGDQAPRGEAEHRELPSRDRQMAGAAR